MSSPQQLGIVAGLKAQRRFSGQEITYTQGASEYTFRAIKGKRQPQLLDVSSYVQTANEITDWIFLLSELDGDTPANGDWIEWQDKRYTLVAAEDGRLWRWMDPEQTWIRAHTVYTGTPDGTTTTAAPTTTTTGA